MSILQVDFEAADAAQQFSQSLRETGFAVIKNHPMSACVIDGVYAEWEEFFAADDATKMEFIYDRNDQNGYYPFLSESAKGNAYANLMEYFHYFSWGRCPKHAKQITEGFLKDMVRLGGTLLEWIEQYLPQETREKLSMPLSEMIQGSEMSTLRIIHYPPLTGNEEEGSLRAADHEDICLLTLLPAATNPGLQVKGKNGEWLEVPCDYGMIIVNAGDMLQMCTDHYYISTTHRVCNPTGIMAKEARMSMPLFLHPRRAVRLSDKYTAGEYLHERLMENKVFDESSSIAQVDIVTE